MNFPIRTRAIRPSNLRNLAFSQTILMLVLACGIPLTPAPGPTPNVAIPLTLTAIANQQTGSNPGFQPAQPTQANPAAAPTQAGAPPATTLPSTVAPPTLALPTLAIPCDRAKFVSETIKDGTKMNAGQVFNKTWTLNNNGSCPWNSAYAVVYDHGEQMGAAPATNFTAASIAPGQNVEVTVTLTAPNQPGTYQGYFMLKNASGQKYGIGDNASGSFWVKIVVAGAAGPTVYKSDLLTIPQTWTVDLDSGSLGPASGADIHYEVDINSNHNLVFLGPAKLFVRQPTYQDCANAQMDSPTVPISGLSLGTFFCYLTDAGRLGFLEYAGTDLTPGAGKLYLQFTTWNKP